MRRTLNWRIKRQNLFLKLTPGKIDSSFKNFRANKVLSTEHTLGQIQQFISPTRKKLKGLLLVSLTSLAKLNFVLFWAKLHLFSKTLEKCKQRYLMNQKFIKGLITYQGK